ncbi:PadR family transcriptional regulator [Oscillospiraceae bacterium WX1]
MTDPSLLSGLIGELRRGSLTLAVLSRLTTPRYGYALHQCLEEKGIRIEANTLYPLLRRLEAQGLVDNTWDTSSPRPRKYYVLNDDGRALFDALTSEWIKLRETVERLLSQQDV